PRPAHPSRPAQGGPPGRNPPRRNRGSRKAGPSAWRALRSPIRRLSGPRRIGSRRRRSSARPRRRTRPGGLAGGRPPGRVQAALQLLQARPPALPPLARQRAGSAADGVVAPAPERVDDEVVLGDVALHVLVVPC